MVFAKVLAHWLVTGLPLIVAAPLLALLLNMEPEGFPVLIATLAVGTPTLSLIGAIGAALTLGARRGGVLLSLLILPLYIPVLIFGAGAIDASLSGFTARPHLLLLCGLLVAALPLAPWAGAAALAAGDRIGQSEASRNLPPRDHVDLLHSGLTRSGRTAEADCITGGRHGP